MPSIFQSGLFPRLSSMLNKPGAVPQEQQKQNPMQYQNMPQQTKQQALPQGLWGSMMQNVKSGYNGMAGKGSNEEFNEQQKQMNRGYTRRGMGGM